MPRIVVRMKPGWLVAARRDELGDHACDEPDDDGPDDAHGRSKSFEGEVPCLERRMRDLSRSGQRRRRRGEPCRGGVRRDRRLPARRLACTPRCREAHPRRGRGPPANRTSRMPKSSGLAGITAHAQASFLQGAPPALFGPPPGYSAVAAPEGDFRGANEIGRRLRCQRPVPL